MLTHRTCAENEREVRLSLLSLQDSGVSGLLVLRTAGEPEHTPASHLAEQHGHSTRDAACPTSF